MTFFQDQALECHAMKNGSTFSKSYSDLAQHKNGGFADGKSKFSAGNAGSMDYQVRSNFLYKSNILTV